MGCVPPPTGASHVVGVTAKFGDAPLCVTVIVWPATVTIASRAFTDPLLSPAVSVTAPDPVPLSALSVSHV
jgi:hypothetical protein